MLIQPLSTLEWIVLGVLVMLCTAIVLAQLLARRTRPRRYKYVAMGSGILKDGTESGFHVVLTAPTDDGQAVRKALEAKLLDTEFSEINRIAVARVFRGDD